MHDHYKKDVTGLKFIDVYRVCKLFNVTDPCIQHAVKKLLCAGQRGAKSFETDIREAGDSINRALQMIAEDCNQSNGGYAHPLPEEKPWYPDDSGEWVEFKALLAPIEFDVKCEVLLKQERKQRDYKKVIYLASDYDWNQAVAYKVIQ